MESTSRCEVNPTKTSRSEGRWLQVASHTAYHHIPHLVVYDAYLNSRQDSVTSYGVDALHLKGHF